MNRMYRGLLLAGLLLLVRPTPAEVYDLPPDGSDVVGAVTSIRARAADTLIDIARRHGLGYEDIVIANPGVDVWLPGEGTEVLLPTRYVLPPGPRQGVVLNLAEYRMYYYPPVADGERPTVMTFPMSIGRMDWETPLGRTRIISKVRKPSWYPPASVREEHEADGRTLPRIVPPGPDNPLGDYAMRLDLPGYLIHGTNRPAGVGMRVTHGCIRMFPEDIEYLFERLAVNTPVRIINEPIKLGWDGDELVLEVHRTLLSVPVAEPDAPEQAAGQPDAAEDARDGEPRAGDEADAAAVAAAAEPPAADTVEAPAAEAAAAAVAGAGEGPAAAAEDLPPARTVLTMLTERYVDATRSRQGLLDWDAAEQLVMAPSGIPAGVGRGIKNAATSAASE